MRALLIAMAVLATLSVHGSARAEPLSPAARQVPPPSSIAPLQPADPTAEVIAPTRSDRYWLPALEIDLSDHWPVWVDLALE